ncbi:hypothetical protein GCM10023185_42170 [Hymenobacter saemangeumensis]|uniref:RiboL-PSP-HEPN domain-containing protein n=1 Tax=Hymenobacter saemangeumensis TaxID=1084522 RepID=A0ABP8IRL4_9BACT
MTQEEKEKIEDVVFILNSTANEVEHYVESAKEVFTKNKLAEKSFPRELIPEEKLIQAAFMFIVIRICSFMDEWDDQIGELIAQGIEPERFRKLKKVTKPVSKEIRKFTGLVEMRNLLAHNARIQKQGYANAYRGGYIASLKVPITIPDYMLVSDCLKIMKEILNKAFPECVQLPGDFIAANTGRNLPVGITEAEKSAIIADLIKQVTDNIASYNIAQGGTA